MNDNINTSEEEWIVETPPPVRKYSNTNHTSSKSRKLPSYAADKILPNNRKMDIYDEFEEEWILETPPNCKPFQKNHEIKKFPGKSTLKSLSMNEISAISVDKNKSEKRKFENRSSLKKNVLTDTSEEEWIVDSPPLHNTNKANKAFEERCEKSYCRRSPVGLNENSVSYESKCGKSCNKSEFELHEVNESCEYKYPKSHSEMDVRNNTDKKIHKKSFGRKAIHSQNETRKSNENRFVNTPYRSGYKSDRYEDDKRKWTPNIEAPEFVPESTKRSQSKVSTGQILPLNSSTYSPFSLRDLLNYDVDLMPSEELMDYVNVLKSRVLSQIRKFEPSYREELEILCQLNDGSLTDRHKKVISLRICTLVKRTLENEPECNQQRYRRHTVLRGVAD